MTNTSKELVMGLRNCTLYSIFVRNHGGTFRAVARDIPRIRELGVDAVWLLPIYPIGKEKRKGSLGSPYAISDYRAVNPEYGTMDDFLYLADVVHQNGMKLLIDVVYNHTSPDSVLAKTHPEWFYHKPDGSFGNRIGDWTDIIDLDYSKKDLWDYQIETLKQWAAVVDGFRCDVAPLVPLGFWLKAREEVSKVRPDCIWLAESVDFGFVRYNRLRGMTALSDSELYRAFDICYDYDVYDDFLAYVQDRAPLSAYTEALLRQEAIYPVDYIKLRFLENHDRTRAAALFPDPVIRRNWLAWCFFQKGIPLLYSGQEWAPTHTPTLFDSDPVDFSGTPELSGFIKELVQMKKDPLFSDGFYTIEPHEEDILTASWQLGNRIAIGIFNLKGKESSVSVPLEDGVYRNLLGSEPVAIESGSILSEGEPFILLNSEI